jgi:ribonucleoside-triphosphate reductase
MFTKIRKADGGYRMFNPDKISTSILRAMSAAGSNGKDPEEVAELAIKVLPELIKYQIPTTDEIGNAVEKALMESGLEEAAKNYILYREERRRFREGKSSLLNAVGNIRIEGNKDNANTDSSTLGSKLLQISDKALNMYNIHNVVPQESAQAHENGEIHIHDLAFYGLSSNCVSIPVQKLLLNGFNTGNGRIRPPRRPDSIFALAAIVIQSNQNEMFGGQSLSFWDRDMAEIIRQNCKEEPSEEAIYQAISGFFHNMNSMASRWASQKPFSNINLGTDTSKLGRLITRSSLRVMQEGMDGFTFIWPNVIFKIKSGINYEEGTPNHDLYLMALETAAAKMNPTFVFMDSSFNIPFGEEVTSMGCRSRIISNVNGPELIDGRGNISFTTINIPRIAFESKGNLEKLYNILDERMSLVKNQLIHRLELTGKLKKRDFPFLMGEHIYIGSENIKDDDEIYSCLIQGTQSIGFCGLEEAVKIITGRWMWESEESWQMGYNIIKYMRDFLNNCTKEYKLNFTLFQTPAESAAGKFCRMDKEKFGEIEGITDKEFYTNSSHMLVDAPITVLEKIEKEAPFHALTNAGHICHIFLDASPQGNMEAIKQIVEHAKEQDIGYLGVNYPINECKDCKFSDPITQEQCPKCGSTNINRIRRITGYLSPTTNWNDSKLAELDRRKDK